MKLALVTGANGFLGSYLVRQLLGQGYRVRGFVRKRNETLANSGVELFQGDLRNADSLTPAVRDCDVVFHAAGVSGIWG